MKKLILFICFFTASGLFSQTANIISRDYKEASASMKYSIVINYPAVDYGTDALMGIRGIAQDINSCVDTLWKNRLGEFKTSFDNMTNVPCAENMSNLEVNYKTVFNTNSLFSFRFETFSSPACANHPMTSVSTLNYSALSVGAFSFSDMFLKDKPYLKFVSQYCIKELKEKAKKDGLLNSDENIEQGASSNADNFRVFNVSKDGIEIIFNPYQAGPWVWGIQTVTIPYGKIKDLVDPQGPVGEFVK